jgi:cell division protein FtsL
MGARAETVRKPSTKDRAKHLSVVERRLKAVGKGSKRRTKGFVITVSLLLGGAIVMGVLLEQVLLAQSAFELAELRKNVAAAEVRHEELLLQSANLDSATRIERYARNNLGMVEPAPGTVEYIVADVRTGTHLGVSTVRDGDKPAAGVAGGMRAAASYGGTP